MKEQLENLDKQQITISINCNRELESLISCEIEVNKSQKLHIQNLIDKKKWDEILRLLDDEYDICVDYPNSSKTFVEDESLYFETNGIFIDEDE